MKLTSYRRAALLSLLFFALRPGKILPEKAMLETRMLTPAAVLFGGNVAYMWVIGNAKPGMTWKEAVRKVISFESSVSKTLIGKCGLIWTIAILASQAYQLTKPTTAQNHSQSLKQAKTLAYDSEILPPKTPPPSVPNTPPPSPAASSTPLPLPNVDDIRESAD
jgi:hypothetical protein